MNSPAAVSQKLPILEYEMLAQYGSSKCGTPSDTKKGWKRISNEKQYVWKQSYWKQ